MRLLPLVVSMTLALTLALPSQSARADNMDDFLVSIIGGTLGGVGGITGFTGLVGNAVYLADGERAPLAWQVVGYTGGGITAVGGAVLLGWGIDEEFGFLIGLGSGFLALGLSELLVTVFAGMQPEAPEESEGDAVLKAPPSPSYGLTPLIVPRADGATTYGVSFSVQGF
jgi:hypothetical protein